MKKLLGIFLFLCLLYVSILLSTDPEYWGSNHFNLGQRIGLSGILCLGAGSLIVSGGVDLSIGSVVGLCATVFSALVLDLKLPIPLAIVIVLLTGAAIGALNGVLVTYLGVQPFVVTLCGLFAYRGVARWITNDEIPKIADQVGDWNRFFQGSFLALPIYLWLLLVLFAAVTFFLHFTIYGRYLYAIGSNERAARYSGINVDFYRILAYVLCSLFASIYALMYVIYYTSVQASSTGNFLELYAIAGAVLGGCSLRGGEGTTVGMLIGAAILSLLNNLINMAEIKDSLELTVVGAALLFCAILDEMLRRGIGWRDVGPVLRDLRTRWFG
jgi:ribose transport system permease protein